MSEALVHVKGRDEPLSVRINGPDPTFHLGTEKLEAQLLCEIAPRYHDFMEIASAVFAADGSVRRGGSVRSDMGARWRRGFRFRIPVRDTAFWSDADVSGLLLETASFLTDDDYAFEFVPLNSPAPREPYLDLDPDGALFRADDVVLFSGGLDSFSGALDLLANSDDKIILVSHRSAQKVIPRQVTLGAYLAERFPERVKHLHVTARRKGAESADTTQRSRTLLFTAIAAAVCQAFEARRINFFENGIVSHNLPISPQVVGTMATRTTHPLALSLLGRLVSRLGDNTIRLQNPFEWHTKREVVTLIRKNDHDTGASVMIDNAVSCTNVRDQDKLHTHCGVCSQCLDRRFALMGAGLEKFDPPERYQTDILHGPRTTHQSRILAVEWTRHALRSSELSDRVLIGRFGLEVARIAEGYPDLPMGDVIGRMIELHQRHGENVRAVLRATIDRALEGKPPLHPQSLVALHLTDGREPEEGALAVQSGVAPPQAVPDEIEEHDTVLDPAAPLTVSFFRNETDVAVLKVVGLCDVTHLPAEVAHRLKPFFDEDRANGLAHDEHRYRLSWQVWNGPKPETFRQNVTRCRKQIARAFEDLHGFEPPDHLLIQNLYGSGYRLDPTINLVARGRLTRD